MQNKTKKQKNWALTVKIEEETTHRKQKKSTNKPSEQKPNAPKKQT